MDACVQEGGSPPPRKPAWCFTAWFLAGVLLFGLLFGVASYYYPLKADDYHYAYTIVPGDDGYYKFSEERIGTWSELAAAVYNHRFMHLYNGRLANSAVQFYLFLTGGGKLLFSVLNVLALGAFVYLAQKLCWGGASASGTALCLLLSCLFITDIATVFWLASAFNYLWGCVFFLSFLILLQRVLDKKEQSRRHFIAGLCCAFVCGWWHEAMGVALCSGMAILYVLRRGKCSSSYIWYGVALLLGGLLILSTGMFDRMDGGDTSPLPYKLLHMLYNARESCILYLALPVAVLLVCMAAGRFKTLRGYKDDILLPLVPFYAALCIAFAWKGSCQGACGFFFPVTLLLLLTLKAMQGACRRIPGWLSLGFLYMSCAGMGWAMVQINWYLRTSDRVMELCDQSPESEVIVFEENQECRFDACEWFFALRRSASLFNQVGPCHGKQRFYLLINRHPQERVVYAGGPWRECGMEGGAACRHGDNLIVRFPRALYYANGEAKAVCSMADGTQVVLPSIRWSGSVWNHYRRYTPDSLCSYDCDDTYFYLILPGMGKCSQVEFVVTPRHGEGNIPVGIRNPSLQPMAE